MALFDALDRNGPLVRSDRTGEDAPSLDKGFETPPTARAITRSQTARAAGAERIESE
jgi:hypothetical protein